MSLEKCGSVRALLRNLSAALQVHHLGDLLPQLVARRMNVLVASVDRVVGRRAELGSELGWPVRRFGAGGRQLHVGTPEPAAAMRLFPPGLACGYAVQAERPC